MRIDNYKTVPKMSVGEMIENALNRGLIISNPIEHYSIDEIKRLSELARDNNLILSIKQERDNFYQGIMINLIERSKVQECNFFIKYL